MNHELCKICGDEGATFDDNSGTFQACICQCAPESKQQERKPDTLCASIKENPPEAQPEHKHTEAELQHMLEYVDKITRIHAEPTFRRILKVPKT